MGDIKEMKILILGGTEFVGRHIAEAAVIRGHVVTLFNRGHAEAPRGCTSIIGDRLAPGGYAALNGLAFDVVIDTWSTDPVAVKSAVDALRSHVKQYIYVSSISVYDFKSGTAPYSESTKLLDPDKAPGYFHNKIWGERYASESGVPTTIVRPGLVLGPYENIWRLPWWLQRMERGGPTLAPGPKDMALQFIDGRDLAKFVLGAAEFKLEGAFNLVSEMGYFSWEDFLETANKVAGENAQLCWLDPEKVTEAGIGQWVELPMWLLPNDPGSKVDVTKALKAGMEIRSAKETIVDTWKWLKTLDEMPSKIDVGLDPEKEREALRKYYESGIAEQ
jgi:2'-hydroxyisoflavone reductase